MEPSFSMCTDIRHENTNQKIDGISEVAKCDILTKPIDNVSRIEEKIAALESNIVLVIINIKYIIKTPRSADNNRDDINTIFFFSVLLLKSLTKLFDIKTGEMAMII